MTTTSDVPADVVPADENTILEDVEVETYRELRTVPEIDLGPDHVALQCPQTGELFAIERASVTPPGVLVTPTIVPPAPETLPEGSIHG